jgi:hypothetical protein
MSQPGVSNYFTGTLRGLECVPLQVGGSGRSCPNSMRPFPKNPDRCARPFRSRAANFTGMNSDTTPNPEKPPEQWVTGREPMTGPQISYLQTLCREAGEEFDATLTKAEASKKIDELQAKTGRGKRSDSA